MSTDDEIDAAKVDEAQSRIIAAFTSMTAGDIEGADQILDELKASSDIAIDTFFGFLLGFVAYMGERLSVDEDQIVQVIALRQHLINEGVEQEFLPGLEVGALPSEEAEDKLGRAFEALSRIQKVSSAALKESASLPQDESDVLRGEAITAIGKLAHQTKEKIQ